jgi:hypothetical protein
MDARTISTSLQSVSKCVQETSRLNLCTLLITVRRFKLTYRSCWRVCSIVDTSRPGRQLANTGSLFNRCLVQWRYCLIIYAVSFAILLEVRLMLLYYPWSYDHTELSICCNSCVVDIICCNSQSGAILCVHGVSVLTSAAITHVLFELRTLSVLIFINDDIISQ